MSYQQVGQCRFYVCALQWLKSLGQLNHANNVPNHAPNQNPLDAVGINPASTFSLSPSSDNEVTTKWEYIFPVQGGALNHTLGRGFIALLGHNMSTHSPARMHSVYAGTTITHSDHLGTDENPVVVNANLGQDANHYIDTDYDGFSIFTTNIDGIGDKLSLDFFDIGTANCNTICFGSYYDMPHSPDLSLTMTREYGGIKTMETKGGASLSNSFYTKPPAWGDLGAWEIASPTGSAPASLYSGYYNQDLARSGRRIWDLSFSYLDDGDVFGANQYLGMLEWGNQTDIIDAEDVGDDPYTYYADNLLTGDNFYSQVIHKTNGQLPFIFQPDKNDLTQFAICKFDQNSFQFKQVAPSLYSIRVKIREVW